MNWLFHGPADVLTPDGTHILDALRADYVALAHFPEGSTILEFPSVVVDAERWFDAREQAKVILHSDELTWQATEHEADVVVRWAGTDAGLRPNRRKVVSIRRATVDERDLLGWEV